MGPNSCVIYSITNYNPQPEKTLPTITQEQDQDYALQQMIQEHADYMQGKTKTSLLQSVNNSIYQTGLSILQGGPNLADTLQAFRQQLEFHDLPSMNRAQLAQFLATPEGQAIQQNIADAQLINDEVGQLAQNRLDIEMEGGEELTRGERLLEARRHQETVRNIGEIHERMRERLPRTMPTIRTEAEREETTIRNLYQKYLNDTIEGLPTMTRDEFATFIRSKDDDVPEWHRREIERAGDRAALPIDEAHRDRQRTLEEQRAHAEAVFNRIETSVFADMGREVRRESRRERLDRAAKEGQRIGIEHRRDYQRMQLQRQMQEHAMIEHRAAGPTPGQLAGTEGAPAPT